MELNLKTHLKNVLILNPTNIIVICQNSVDKFFDNYE